MPSFRHSIDIDATADQVWAVLGDIASVDRWIPGVTSVTVEGMTQGMDRSGCRVGRVSV